MLDLQQRVWKKADVKLWKTKLHSVSSFLFFTLSKIRPTISDVSCSASSPLLQDSGDHLKWNHLTRFIWRRVLGVWCHGAIINPRALELPALSFHAHDLRVWISHCPQQPNLVTGWTTWKQYTELHKESSQSPLPRPQPTSLPSPGGLRRGWWWGYPCHVYNGQVAGILLPELGSLE